MNKIIYLIMSVFVAFFINSCGKDSSKEAKEIVSPIEESNVDFIDEEKYHSIHMIINKEYEVNPNDFYIPKNNNTKLRIEYQPLLDKKFIKILTGEAILKKKIN